jgi:hypothetical protein
MSLIGALNVILSFHRYINPINGLISLIISIYFSVYFDRQVSIQHYGGGLTAIYGVFFITWFFVVYLSLLLKKCFKKSWQLTAIGLIAFILCMRYLLILSCAGWTDGLYGKSLDTSDKYCKLIVPKYCPLTFL